MNSNRQLDAVERFFVRSISLFQCFFFVYIMDESISRKNDGLNWDYVRFSVADIG